MQLKRLFTLTLGAAAGLTALASPGTLRAIIYNESGDAGQTLATAQSTASFGSPNFGQPLTAINGTIAPSTGSGTVYDADLYAIFITNPATFSATTVGFSLLDTSLFLFNANGGAVLANDDASGTSFQSTIPAGNAALASLGAGVYYLGIGLSGAEAINSVSQLLFAQSTTSTDVRTAAAGVTPTTLSTFNNGVTFDESGAYGISLVSATAVPEPSTWALTGAGVLALGVALSRRRRQSDAAAL